MSVDNQGNLIVAGQSKPGASQVFRVKLGPDGVPLSYQTVFSDDGHTLKVPAPPPCGTASFSSAPPMTARC